VRRIIASTYTTLDGFIDNPHQWSLQHNDIAAQRYALDLTLGADTLVLGRATYEGMAQAWPQMGGRLTDALATAGLLDEYRIWIYPVLRGSGEPLFRPESPTGLEHTDTTTFDTGVLVSTYRVTTA
jgi:dihydrofolate reductase